MTTPTNEELDALVARLRGFVRAHNPGQCKMLSLGDGCSCELCAITALREQVKDWKENSHLFLAERDKYKAALGQYPEGRDVILAATLAENEQLRQRIAALESAPIGFEPLPDGTA